MDGFNLWLDVIIVVVIAVFAFIGMGEGFIKSALKLCVIVLSFIVAKIFSPMLSTLLSTKTQIYQKILQTVSEKIVPNIQGTGDMGQASESLIAKLMEKITINLTQGAVGLAESIALFIFNLFCFVLVFIFAWIILKMISSLIEKIAELPVIRVFNKAGGALLGIVKGVVIMVIVLNAAYYLNMLLGFDKLTQMFEASYLMKYFYLTSIISMFNKKE